MLCCCSKGNGIAEPVLTWGEPITVCKGGYGRVHPLADGTLMLVYSLGGSDYGRISKDGGSTWGEPAMIMESYVHQGVTIRCSNPEFAQLSGSNPYHPGRIIFAANMRPENKKSTVHPFSIVISVSDDGGRTWSARKPVYEPPLWDEDVSKGAWEPFVLELPDGRVQIYFTDNTPYYAVGDTRSNNISYIESSDGGDTWSKETIVCHTPGGWDGMPVIAMQGGRLHLVVEHKDARGSDKAMELMLRTSTEDFSWKKASGTVVSIGEEGYYCGAPYIINTGKYLIVSGQSAKGSTEPLVDKYSVPAVWYGSSPASLKPASRPLDIDQSQYSGLWNSLCPLGEDSFLLITQHRSKILIVKGIIK